MSNDPLPGWFILELMGHRRLAGYVSEQTIAGAGFLRIDIPGEEEGGQPGPGTTQLYPPSSVYCMTPTTEELARHLARSSRPAPVQPWEIQRALPEPHPAELIEDEVTGDEDVGF